MRLPSLGALRRPTRRARATADTQSSPSRPRRAARAALFPRTSMQERSALPQHGAVLRGELLGHDTNARGGTQLLEERLPERGIHQEVVRAVIGQDTGLEVRRNPKGEFGAALADLRGKS